MIIILQLYFLTI